MEEVEGSQLQTDDTVIFFTLNEKLLERATAALPIFTLVIPMFVLFQTPMYKTWLIKGNNGINETCVYILETKPSLHSIQLSYKLWPASKGSGKL